MQLVRWFRALRRFVRAAFAPVSALALVAVVTRPDARSSGRAVLTLGALSVLAALARLRARALARRTDRAVAPVEGGSALVVVALSYVGVAYTGGVPRSPLAALPLLAVAAVGALGARGTGLLAALFALFAEALFYRDGGGDPRALLVRGGLLTAAALLHHGLTRAEIARVRTHAEKLLAEERARQKEAARSFRLIAAPSPAPHKPRGEDDKRVRSSLDEIRDTLTGLLELTRRAMGLRTCALFWLDAKGEALRMVEVATDAPDELSGEPIAVGAGAVGGACAMGRPVVLSKLRPDYGGLSYYGAAPHGVRAFAALPIRDGGSVRGVLVADRAEDLPFGDTDQATLELVATQTLRHVHNERVFGMLEKSKDELAKLFAASRALGEALTEDEVLGAVLSSARSVAEHDLAVVATYDEKTHEHKVRHAAGAGAQALSGVAFQDNSGIASAAVKTKHALPYRGHFDGRTQYVFTRNAPLEGNESVLCLPLVVRDHAIGTLTLAAKRRGAFPDATRQLLGVLAAHAAVAVSNAKAVRRLEEMATTDPMTGLLNKRAMESEFERRVRSAARFGKKLSVIVTDIDKFKSVNDTYGHATGDVVIKGLGALLAKCKRETDAVARFGGEEFVIVCEETDTEGAVLLAERIRTELGKTVFATEMGPLSVTCSLGVAEFPRDADTREALFSRADEALYEAKRGGRNQTRVAGRRSAPVSAAGAKKGAARPDATAKTA